VTRIVGILIFPDFQLLDAAGPATAFDVATRLTTPPAYRVRALARVAGPVTSSSGVTLMAESFPDSRLLDMLIVAGGRGTRDAVNCETTLGFLREAAAGVPRVASVCTGAFLLAATGLLDGRQATTHWRLAASLARNYPRVKVSPDRIFVRDGRIWTSAGITAGIDLALALIAEDLGEAVAKRTAQELVVYYRRPGSQSQYSALLELDGAGGRFAPLLAWTRERLSEPLSVERLADGSRSRANALKGGPIPSIGSRDSLDLAIRSECAAPLFALSGNPRNPCAAVHGWEGQRPWHQAVRRERARARRHRGAGGRCVDTRHGRWRQPLSGASQHAPALCRGPPRVADVATRPSR